MPLNAFAAEVTHHFADVACHFGPRNASSEARKNMEVTTQYLGNTKFAVSARGHRLISDQPRDNRGDDAGMTPPELMLASLGACAGYYAAEYLNARRLDAEHLTIRVTAEKAASPARIGSFRIEVCTADLDQRHQAGLLRAVKACLIHNTLTSSPGIEVAVNTPVAA